MRGGSVLVELERGHLEAATHAPPSLPLVVAVRGPRVDGGGDPSQGEVEAHALRTVFRRRHLRGRSDHDGGANARWRRRHRLRPHRRSGEHAQGQGVDNDRHLHAATWRPAVATAALLRPSWRFLGMRDEADLGTPPLVEGQVESVRGAQDHPLAPGRVEGNDRLWPARPDQGHGQGTNCLAADSRSPAS